LGPPSFSAAALLIRDALDGNTRCPGCGDDFQPVNPSEGGNGGSDNGRDDGLCTREYEIQFALLAKMGRREQGQYPPAIGR
jgi:hypothetical protein